MTTPNSADPTVVPINYLATLLDRLEAGENPRVVVVVLTWNSSTHIDACLDSIEQFSIPVATLVIDNGSSDNTVALVERRRSSDLVVFRSNLNLGYAGGNNIGLTIARSAGADFAVIVNPDATLAPTCVEQLVDALSADANIGLASPAICHFGTDRLWYAGSDVDLISGAAHHLHEGSPLASLPLEPYETGRASGCVLALVPARLEDVGVLDERYFLYYEETDWSIRTKEHGLRIIVVPGAIAWHDVGHGSGGVNPAYQYYMTRNRLLLASDHGRHGAIGALPGSLRNSLVALIAMARIHRDAFIPCTLAILHGYIDFARNRFGQRQI